MAIFIASTKSISRGSGQSAVASASYRAGVALVDHRYGRTHDYSKRHGVMSADIILPKALVTANATIERSDLWNKAEAAERRVDARVAREWLVNLPYELSEQDRKKLAHSFAQTLADRYGTIADCAIHKPTDKEIERGADPRNYHAHILFTTRCAELGDNNEITLTDKATIELSDKKRRSLGLERVSDEIKKVRQLWEQIANEKLAERNLSLIDSRSYANQGKDIEPQLKMGSVATKLERDKYEQELEKAEQANKKGEVYEIDETPATIRGEINALIAERNALVLQVSNRIIVEKRDLNERLERAERSIERADQRIGFSKRWINSNSNRASRSEQNIEWALKRCESLPKRIDDTTQRIDSTASANDRLTQRIDGTKQSINSITSAIGRSDIEIDKAVERSARPAPTPFDDNARRARAARLAREQEQFDTAAANYARRTYYYDRAIERASDRSRLVRREYAGKFLHRKLEANSLRPGWSESSDDYPHKLDYRQSDIIEDFAQQLRLNKESGEDQRDYMRRVGATFTIGFLEANKAIMDLLLDPKAERDQYDAIKTHYDTFINSLNEQRKVIDDNTKRTLGNTGEVSRMTAESLSAPHYINALDDYINNESTADQNKTLAIKQRATTINRTCQQFKHGMIDLSSIREADKRQTHSEALQASLNNFMSSYGKELSNDQKKAINDGLSATTQQIQSNTMRFSR